MARTKGAKDLKKRKERSDKKNRYVVRNGKMVKYVPKRSRDDPVSIEAWKREPMSKQGYAKWNVHVKKYIKRKITAYRICFLVDNPNQYFGNKDKIAKWAETNIGYKGEFVIMGRSHGKNKYHNKPVPLCRVMIHETQAGIKAYVTETQRLSRYWFWDKRAK